jgi:pimeloyl-ACP methyl ester carboxylesterase
LLKNTKPNSTRLFRKARYGTDKFILVQKYKIHYVDAGQGEPIVLIPGSSGSYRIWNRLIPLLADQFRLLALDYPPVLAVEKDALQALRGQSDLIALMARQLNIDKINLIGIGSGGKLAFDVAARYPELAGKIVSILGHLAVPVGKGKAAKKSAYIEDELKSIRSPILYLYGTRTNEREITLAKNLELLQKHQPRAWIVALEGGIFETATKNPAEVVNLILDFLKARTNNQ